MTTTRTWTMSITEMLRSPVVVFLTIASCVAGAPLQIEGENIGLGQAVYSQPELAAALARTYEALESEERNRENEISARNLDHIGGGNLLRNLDHIGGGNLLRDLDSQAFANSRLVRNEPSANQQGNEHKPTRRPGLDYGFKDDPSKWPENRGTLDSIGGGNIVRRRDISSSNEFERNLDHIGGGNLLRNLKTLDPLGGPNTVRRDFSSSNEFERNLDHIGGGNLLRNLRTLDPLGGPNTVRRDIGSSNKFERNLDHIGGGNLLRNLRTLDPIGGPNTVRRDISNLNEFERNLDHIGGGNLLRNLDSQRFTVSRLVRDEPTVDQHGNELSTRKPGLADGFKDDPSKWPENRGTLDSLGGGNIVRRRDISSSNEFERNLDHIGGGNLLRNLRTLDPIGGSYMVRRDTGSLNEFERNLDHIGGGNLLRDLDSQKFSRLVRSEPFTIAQDIHKYRTTLKPDLLKGFKDDPSKWDPERGTLDSIGGGNVLSR